LRLSDNGGPTTVVACVRPQCHISIANCAGVTALNVAQFAPSIPLTDEQPKVFFAKETAFYNRLSELLPKQTNLSTVVELWIVPEKKILFSRHSYDILSSPLWNANI
jgi:hypothetical protein